MAYESFWCSASRVKNNDFNHNPNGVCSIMRGKSLHCLFVILFVWLCMFSFCPSAAFAEKEDEGSPPKKPFFLSPEANVYLPTNSKTKDVFGSNWSGIGVGINPEAFGWDEPDFKLGGITLSPYFAYYNTEKRGNDAHIIPIGVETRWLLGDNEKFQPYAGLGLSISVIKFEDKDAGIKTGWKTAPGARVVLGADINKWLNLRASYNFMGSVEGYNFSGFSIGAEISFYF
jgi:hypothetical protein